MFKSMRKILIILVLSGLNACEDEDIRFFNAECIDDLDLANLEFFWKVGSAIDTTYTGGEMFLNDPGHISGKRFFSEADIFYSLCLEHNQKP